MNIDIISSVSHTCSKVALNVRFERPPPLPLPIQNPRGGDMRATKTVSVLTSPTQ